jgi:hypothetical protein
MDAYEAQYPQIWRVALGMALRNTDAAVPEG